MQIQIIPDRNIDNTRVLGLVENLHFFRPLKERMKYISTKDMIGVKIDNQHSIKYSIFITKENVSFFLEFPDELKENVLTELNICWKNATFKETDKKPVIQGETKELELAEHFFLALNCDMRGEFPLSNILETQNILREEEKILISISLTPISHSWRREQEDCIKNFEQGKFPTKTLFSMQELPIILSNAFLDIAYTAIDFINDLITDTKIEHEKISTNYHQRLLRNGLSNETKEKSRYNAYKTKFQITVESNRKEILFVNILKAFNSMAGDNRFIMVNKSKYCNILCSKEIAQIMQMPTKYYQETYRINSIENREIDIPKELLTGTIPIGETIYKGTKIQTYWPIEKNVFPLPKIIVGPQGAGKSQYIKNYIYHAYRSGNTVVVFDYIKSCELTKSLEKYYPNAIRINLSNYETLPALTYPEIKPKNNSKFERLKVANILARQVEYLLNSLSHEPLSPRMARYLDAASKVVFIHENAKVADVINVLLNWKVRNEYIRKAKYSECFSENDMEIVDLESLHEREGEEGKIIGTKEYKIEGIIDRITTLQKDLFLRRMMEAETDYNYDFKKWFEEGKIIFIQIDDKIYTNKSVIDTIVTYFMSRIWLAAIQREDTRKTVHVITDEIHQVPTAASLLSNFITESRKFNICFVFTLHYFKQFRALYDAVKSAGTSYMLLAGTEKENLMALEHELQPFTIQEILRLKQFHSANIINIGNQYITYISKLPPLLN